MENRPFPGRINVARLSDVGLRHGPDRCRDLVKATRTGAWLVLVFLFAIATTSVSLSAKTAQLGMIVALLMTMLRKAGTDIEARSI